jgi:ribosomal protein S18 acetylase RimI-like enzyme
MYFVEAVMEIRTMGISDYEGVYALWLSTPGMGLNASDDSREGIAKYLARNPGTCFVALEHGEIIGVILSGHDGRRGFIHHTAVKASLQGGGIGRALLSRAMAALEEEGINKVVLVCFEKNEAGNAFWERAGFTAREDLVYRNKSIRELRRIDT